MAARSLLREGDNAFERTIGVLDLINKIPETMSDDELEGMARYINPDLRSTVLALFELEASRSLEIFFIQRAVNLLKEAQEAKSQGKKLVFTSATTPPELIFAFENLFPLCTEIVGGLAVIVCAGQGERFWDFAMGLGLPDSLCSANTIAVASLCMGPTLSPDAIISHGPGSCNPNAKIHAFAADYLGVPQYVVEKPNDESDQARETYFNYTRALVRDLEELAGEKLSEQRLRETLERANRSAELFSEMWELKKARPCPVPNIFSPTLMVIRAQMWGRQDTIEVLERMVDISRSRLEKGEFTAPEEIARVYLTYIPFFFDLHGFFTWTEKRGITILGDLLGVQFFPAVDTSSTESMIRGISDIAFEYPMTRQMGGSSMGVSWLEDISYAVSELGADCCIFCGHHACKHSVGSITFFRREMMKRSNVPTLVVMGDAFDRRHLPMSMIQEEIERFVRKAGPGRRGPRRRKAPRKKR